MPADPFAGSLAYAPGGLAPPAVWPRRQRRSVSFLLRVGGVALLVAHRLAEKPGHALGRPRTMQLGQEIALDRRHLADLGQAELRGRPPDLLALRNSHDSLPSI